MCVSFVYVSQKQKLRKHQTAQETHEDDKKTDFHQLLVKFTSADFTNTRVSNVNTRAQRNHTYL